MNRKTLLTLGLLIVFVLSACTPSASAPPPPTPTLASESAVPAPTVGDIATLVPAIAVLSESTEEAIVALPTSRGDELAATDPTTVNIASGKPQLIEFFAFW